MIVALGDGFIEEQTALAKESFMAQVMGNKPQTKIVLMGCGACGNII